MFITIIIISDLTTCISVRSVLKKGVFSKCVNSLFKELTCQTGNGFIEVGRFAFDSLTVIRFDLKLHPLGINL